MKVKLAWVSKPKTVQTERGEVEKFYFKIEGKENQLISCFVGKWNKDFKAGQEVEIGELKSTGTGKNRDGSPVEYFQASAPENTKPGFKVDSKKVDDLEARITKLEEQIVEIYSALQM